MSSIRSSKQIDNGSDEKSPSSLTDFTALQDPIARYSAYTAIAIKGDRDLRLFKKGRVDPNHMPLPIAQLITNYLGEEEIKANSISMTEQLCEKTVPIIQKIQKNCDFKNWPGERFYDLGDMPLTRYQKVVASPIFCLCLASMPFTLFYDLINNAQESYDNRNTINASPEGPKKQKMS